MKANEAPEKIWLDSRSVFLNKPNKSRLTEYIQTDAFIEKACSWLENNLQGIVGGSIYIEDFRKYMKGGNV